MPELCLAKRWPQSRPLLVIHEEPTLNLQLTVLPPPEDGQQQRPQRVAAERAFTRNLVAYLSCLGQLNSNPRVKPELSELFCAVKPETRIF